MFWTWVLFDVFGPSMGLGQFDVCRDRQDQINFQEICVNKWDPNSLRLGSMLILGHGSKRCRACKCILAWWDILGPALISSCRISICALRHTRFACTEQGCQAAKHICMLRHAHTRTQTFIIIYIKNWTRVFWITWCNWRCLSQPI